MMQTSHFKKSNTSRRLGTVVSSEIAHDDRLKQLLEVTEVARGRWRIHWIDSKVKQ